MYDALDVAAFVIRFQNKENLRGGNLRLQKILYFLQAGYLVETGRPLFKNRIEAWAFGPVVPDVYMKYEFYPFDWIPDRVVKDESLKINGEDAEKIATFLKAVDPYPNPWLVDLTLNQDPWKNTYKEGKNAVITNDSILAYFKKQENSNGIY